MREMDPTKAPAPPPGLGFEPTSDKVKHDELSSEPRAFPRRRPDLTDAEAERAAVAESVGMHQESK